MFTNQGSNSSCQTPRLSRFIRGTRTMSKGPSLGYRRTWTPLLAASHGITDRIGRSCRAGGWESESSVIRGTRLRTSENPCPSGDDGTLVVIDSSSPWRNRTGIRSQSNPSSITPSGSFCIPYGTLAEVTLWRIFGSSQAVPSRTFVSKSMAVTNSPSEF